MIHSRAIEKLRDIVGPKGILTGEHDLMLYEYDASIEKGLPDCVVFPTSTEDVVRIVKVAREYDLPLVGRGAGTGLSGGTIATQGGVMIAFARMNRVIEIDLDTECAVVAPGVVNLDITLAVQGDGY